VATNVASWYVHEDLMDDALRLIRQGIAIAMATKQLPQAGATHIALARALRSVGDLEGALAAAREAVRLLEPPPGETGLGRILAFAAAMATQAGILGEDNNISMGRTSEAISLYERAFDIVIGYVRKDANDSLSRFNASLFGARLARLLEDRDPRGALAINDELLLRLREIRNNTRARRYEVPTLVRSSYLLRRLGREAEGRERLKMAFANLRDLKMYPSEQVELGSEPDHAVRALAEQEAAGGNTRRGGQIYEELLGKIMASKPKPESRLADAYDLSTLYSAMGVLYRKAGQGGPATAMDSRRLELWQRWDRKLPKNVFVRKQLDGAAASQR
jgi:tetratricopeptide (TPR) repeat protein